MTGRYIPRYATEDGSALPILLAGLMFLVVLGLTLLGSLQLLQQQRRVNAITDTMALDLTSVAARGAVTTLDERAAQDLQLLYDVNGSVPEITVVSPTSVRVRLCEPVSALIAITQSVGAQSGSPAVCAESQAQVKPQDNSLNR